MSLFSPKEKLIIFAAIVWTGVFVWIYVLSGSNLNGFLINVLSDIPFALFVVWFVEYANERDRELRNQSRQRAVARSIQKLYQNIARIIATLIEDGVACSQSLSLPIRDLIETRAKQHNANTLLRSNFLEQPIPFGAYFICDFTGTTSANVYPPRDARTLLIQLGSEQDQLYRDIFQLDGGFLPDDVVDALVELKDHPIIVFCNLVLAMQPSRIGYWPEDELNKAVFYLGTLQAYFSLKFGYELSKPDAIVKDAVENALNKRRAQQARAQSSALENT